MVSPAAYPNEQRAELYRRLLEVLPGEAERLFFCNSGTEAVEAALKFARLLTGRPEIVALMRGFHGRTLGSLSTTWERRYRAPFEPLLPKVKHISATNLASLEDALDETTACLLLEVVQGRVGCTPLPRSTCSGQGSFATSGEFCWWWTKSKRGLAVRVACLPVSISV